MNKSSITSDINGSVVELTFEIKITQGDSKVWKEVLRINSAFRKHCHLKHRDAAKASVIQNGCQKTRISQGIIDQWYQLMDRDDIGLSVDIKEVYKNCDSHFNISHFAYGTGHHLALERGRGSAKVIERSVWDSLFTTFSEYSRPFRIILWCD